VAAAWNVYRREYDGADVDLIWQTVKHDLCALFDVAVFELDRIAG